MIFLRGEEALIRNLLLVILSLLVLSSCSKENSKNALVSSAGGEISIVDGDSSLLFLLDGDTMKRLCDLSGLSPIEMISDLEDGVEVFFVPPEVFRKREKLIDLICSQNRDKNRVELLVDNYNIIENSDLLRKLDTYSASFDSAMFATIKGVEQIYQFDISSVLYGADQWEIVKEFYSEWKKAIIR